MKRSIPSLLVLGLLAALLASCGQAATGQQTGGTPTASSHAHMSRIAWQGFLDHDQTTAAIFSANADGTGLEQVTSWGKLKAGNAHWSPNGTRILFQSFGAFPADSTPQLYTIFPDGTHLVQLTSKERNSWPVWSPDGTKIIFVYRSTTGVDQNAHLYEMNADGSGLVQVTRNDFWQLQPAWGIAP